MESTTFVPVREIIHGSLEAHAFYIVVAATPNRGRTRRTVALASFQANAVCVKIPPPACVSTEFESLFVVLRAQVNSPLMKSEIFTRELGDGDDT